MDCSNSIQHIRNKKQKNTSFPTPLFVNNDIIINNLNDNVNNTSNDIEIGLNSMSLRDRNDFKVPEDNNMVIYNNKLMSKEEQLQLKAYYTYTSGDQPTSNNITYPDVEEVLFCISAVIQAQIFEDLSAPEERKALFNEFNVIPDLPPEYGGHITIIPEEILLQESLHDEPLREQLLALKVPTTNTIFKYLARILNIVRYPPECNIISLVYLNRINAIKRIPLTMNNWRVLWVTCLIIAQKIWNDTPVRTSNFIELLPSITKIQLRDWEKTCLDLLEYQTRVKPSVYAKYYFELRQLFVEILGPRTKTNLQWNFKPLSNAAQVKLAGRGCNGINKSDVYNNSHHDRNNKKSTSNSSKNSNKNNSRVRISSKDDSDISSIESMKYFSDQMK